MENVPFHLRMSNLLLESYINLDADSISTPCATDRNLGYFTEVAINTDDPFFGTMCQESIFFNSSPSSSSINADIGASDAR